LIKLAIVTTHPIQYYAPAFRLLHQRQKVNAKVFYTWEQAQQRIYDPKFGRHIQWDIPLLEGYNYTFVKNTASQPGSHHFRGIITPTLIREISDWQADAVLFFGWSYHGHWQAMRHFKRKIPVLFRGDSNLLDEFGGPRQWLRRTALRFVYRYVDRALYVGTNNRDYYLRHGLKPEQLIFAPHAVENERFERNAENQRNEARDWRSTLGITEQDMVFLFAGKLEPKKNPGLLLDAFLSLSSPNIQLVMVGNGEMEAALKAKAAGRPDVHFLGFQNQSRMPVVYRLANVFVLPSQGPGETWGLAINKAMACGIPILASDKVGCAVDLVEEKINGFVFRSGDPSDLRQKLNQFIEKDPSQLAQMGSASQQRIQNWSLEALCYGIEVGALEQEWA
jgi:glycosyltransferase involved in cell wall biosynthesis